MRHFLTCSIVQMRYITAMTTDKTVRALIPQELFRALCDPTRISILDQLAGCCEPQSVGEVAEAVSADLSVVSRNLRQLREAGLLRCERNGKRVLCQLDTSSVVAQLRSLADALEECCPPQPSAAGDTPGDPEEEGDSSKEKDA